jgi:hypothetical protein
MAVQSWQYIAQVFTEMELQNQLDELGSVGWELVTAQWEPFSLGGRSHMQARCILKRPAKSEDGEDEADEWNRYQRVGTD